MKTSLTPMQQHVAKHYEGGEFAYITTAAQSQVRRRRAVRVLYR